MRPQEKKTQPTGNRPKTARPKCEISHFLAQVGKSASDQQKRAAKAKKKADKEKAGWGIAFSEFIARAGVGLDGAEEMAAAAQL